MKKILICITLIFCVGCGRGRGRASSIQVNIDSISSGKLLNGYKCVILPSDPNNVANDQLQYKEYTAYIKRVLEKNGYEVIDNGGEAKVVIFLNYGISDPHENLYIYNEPVWGQTGVSSSYTTGTINSFGSGMASYSGTTRYTPQYGITGYKSHMGTQITFKKVLVLDAYDLEEYRKTNQKVQLWKTTAISTDSSGDLRDVFPIMVAASAEYIGADTGKQIRMNIRKNDKRVKEIRGLSD